MLVYSLNLAAANKKFKFPVKTYQFNLLSDI